MVRHLALKGYYDLEKTIGSGGFAKVKLGKHLATGEKVAIKIMNKELLGEDLPRVTLELNALKNLVHVNICKLYEVIESETHFYIVMEYCSGGELFDHIVYKNRLSEGESRIFFRQIVSAVAYLHSVGYAHRDLKLENVLLDKHQNVKLIDFGLCAKPEKGMNSLLLTSCGSPTYAAPELISGSHYLGTEVDVWALGVLLYTLLTGSLPFDDLNIDCLYKKILAGKYSEPPYLSKTSRHLINLMLQVNPRHRITMDQVLSHHWLTLGLFDVVEIRPDNLKYYDADCINAMAEFYGGIDRKILWEDIKRWKYDYYTSTYFLLLTKKKRGGSLSLNYNRSLRVNLFKETNLSEVNQQKEENQVNNKKVDNTPKKIIKLNNTGKQKNTPNKMASVIRRPLKRIRSPGLENSSPIPHKRQTQEFSTPTHTPERSSSDTPHKVLGSIERSINRVIQAFSSKDESTPILLSNKNMYNVSTTQCRDPEFVITELTNALEKKKMSCKRKGFTLRGKFVGDLGECSFELEICFLPKIQTKGSKEEFPIPNFVGIKRKRLRGDSWCYKRVCEEVLALTSKGLKGAESGV